MRALLDVNVLLALHDPNHVHHVQARNWFVSQTPHGWASCPITQNGFVRIISQPKYPNALRVSQAISLLRSATSTALHEFWPADISALDTANLDHRLVHGPRQLTDLYLLSLAVSKGGCLATFDRSIPLSAVPGSEARHLEVI